MLEVNDKLWCPRRRESGLGVSVNVDTDPGDRWEDRNGVPCCSYCGSCHPDEFFRAVRDGEHIVPTDKNYKAYVGKADRKFYFQHFNEAERSKFIEACNSKQITFAAPGHFYVLPFFCSRK